MDLSQLEVFLMVAREGRFSRAAEKLFRTQSAVSQTIRKLEQELGEPLFDRSSREGVLTDAGRTLQQYAEQLLNLRADAQEALVELRELQTGKLGIAANEFTALYLLPVLAEFRRLHPMIRITVQRSLGSHIPDDLLRHTVEMGVLTYDPQEPRLRSIVVYLDELTFVVPPTHPLASEKQVSIRQLGTEVFVAHIVSSPYREKVIETFRRHKTPLHMDVELPTLQAITRFVGMGNGVALVPEISVENELARGELVSVSVKELRLHRTLRQFILHADLGNERPPVAHADKARDGLQGGQFHVHVQRSLVPAEGFDHLLAVGRRDDVRDEHLGPQLPDADLLLRSERVSRWNHEGQLVQVHDDRAQPRFLRIVGKNAHLDGVAQQVVGNVAAERPLHRDPDHGMEAAELCQHGQQIERGEFVGRDAQLAGLEFAQLNQGLLRVRPQVEQLLGVLLQGAAGVGEDPFAGGPVKQRLAQLLLEFANGLADRRLGTKQLLGRAREAPLAGHHQEDFELRKVHGSASGRARP